jgi:hypothetical protein
MVAARWRLFETKADATLRIEPFRRLTRDERDPTREEAARLAAFLAPETEVRVDLLTAPR